MSSLVWEVSMMFCTVSYTGSDNSNDCPEISFTHRFRSPLPFSFPSTSKKEKKKFWTHHAIRFPFQNNLILLFISFLLHFSLRQLLPLQKMESLKSKIWNIVFLVLAQGWMIFLYQDCYCWIRKPTRLTTCTRKRDTAVSYLLF